MYNNIGLQTARGTGTNGYIQSNLSNLLFSKNKVEYNTEADIAKAEEEVNRGPNVELLDHEYKRAIEIKCTEFEDLMEGKGFMEEEIRSKVNEYRKLLFTEFESGNLNMDNALDLRNSHTRAKVAKDNRDRMRNALGIDSAFVDGSSLEKLKKASELLLKDASTKSKAELDKEMAQSMMEKIYEKLKEKKNARKGNASSSSSSTSSGSSSSSSDDSSSDSSSDDSTTSSNDSGDQKRKKKVKKRKIPAELITIKKEPKDEEIESVEKQREKRSYVSKNDRNHRNRSPHSAHRSPSPKQARHESSKTRSPDRAHKNRSPNHRHRNASPNAVRRSRSPPPRKGHNKSPMRLQSQSPDFTRRSPSPKGRNDSYKKRSRSPDRAHKSVEKQPEKRSYVSKNDRNHRNRSPNSAHRSPSPKQARHESSKTRSPDRAHKNRPLDVSRRSPSPQPKEQSTPTQHRESKSPDSQKNVGFTELIFDFSIVKAYLHHIRQVEVLLLPKIYIFHHYYLPHIHFILNINICNYIILIAHKISTLP